MDDKDNKVVSSPDAELEVNEYQAYYQDAAGNAQFEMIPIENRQSYIDTFQNRVPNIKDYSSWKEKENIEVIKKVNVQTAGDKTSREGYKFTPEARREIYDYLNSRPMIEVEGMISQWFENPEDPDPFITREGIQVLSKYLQEKCPRKDAKRIIEILANDGLEKYVLKPKKPDDREENMEEKKSEGENTNTTQA